MNNDQRAPASAASRVRPDILTDAFLAALRRRGMVTTQLFGSVTRYEERPDSDIDLLVTFAHHVSFAERFRLSEELSRISGRPVELITKRHPAFAPYIQLTLVPIAI
jgi:predicted nucleotidyltransferase